LTKKPGIKTGKEFLVIKTKSVNNSISKLWILFMIMKNFVTDELVNKVYHLTKALNQANEIIANLKVHNKVLTDALAVMNEDELNYKNQIAKSGLNNI